MRRSWSRAEWATGALVLAMTAVALAVRLHDLGTAPFINDEPRFLADAQRQLATGTWASASPIHGTQGITYGPTVFWFYRLVGGVLGSDPRASIAAMAVVVVAAQVAVSGAIARLSPRPRITFVLLVVAHLVCPDMALWGRQAWDQSTMVIADVVVAILIWRRSIGLRLWALLGLLCGLAISSHPMSLPFVAATGTVLVLDERRDVGRLVRSAGAFVIAGVLVNLPWLWWLMHHAQAGTPEPRNSTGGLSYFLYAVAVWAPPSLTPVIQHSWDGASPLVRAAASGAVGASITLLLLGLVVVGLARTLRSDVDGPSSPARRAALLALVTWVVGTAMATIIGLPAMPHYDFPLLWIAPLGVVLAVRAAARGATATAVVPRLLVGAVVVVLAVQTTLTTAWLRHVDTDAGDRFANGTGVADQLALVETLCHTASGPVLLEIRTTLYVPSVQYEASIDPACAGLDLTYCGIHSVPCPREADYAVEYADATSARLRLVALSG